MWWENEKSKAQRNFDQILQDSLSFHFYWFRMSQGAKNERQKYDMKIYKM